MEPSIGDEHFNEVTTGNGLTGSALNSSRPGTPFTPQPPLASQSQFAQTPPKPPPPPRTARRARTRTGPPRAAGLSWKELAEAGKRHLVELRDYARLLQGVKADRAALELRRKMTRLGLIALGAVVVIALLIGSAMRLISGLARGFALLFEGRVWLGDLVTGVGIIAAVFAAAALLIWRKNKKELAEHARKYERLHDERTAHRAANEAPPLSGPR